jgi:hypothetical protein
MALERCPHCPERVRNLGLHLKRCIKYRRKVKAGMLAIPTEPKEIEPTVVEPQKKKRGRPKKT